MTPTIVSELIGRMQAQPRFLAELHRAAIAAGSSWSEDQIELLLACVPEVTRRDGLYAAEAMHGADPVAAALVELAGAAAIPAAVLVARMPRGVVTTPAALCEIARKHPELELVGSNRIRRK